MSLSDPSEHRRFIQLRIELDEKLQQWASVAWACDANQTLSLEDMTQRAMQECGAADDSASPKPEAARGKGI